MADIIQLEFEVDENRGKGRSKKTFTHADLRDLQSKLALVAGDKQKDMKDTIFKFNAVSNFINVSLSQKLNVVCLKLF